MVVSQEYETEDWMRQLKFLCRLVLWRKGGMCVVWDFKGPEGNSHGARKQMFGR